MWAWVWGVPKTYTEALRPLGNFRQVLLRVPATPLGFGNEDLVPLLDRKLQLLKGSVLTEHVAQLQTSCSTSTYSGLMIDLIEAGARPSSVFQREIASGEHLRSPHLLGVKYRFNLSRLSPKGTHCMLKRSLKLFFG